MNIHKIYQKYNIPPQLQLHQIRVASVAALIADNSQKKIEKDNIISAALLHDMGNIIKFDLTLFPQYLEPEGLEYWQNVQAEFIDKYGNDEHIATFEICRALAVSDRVQELVEGVGFSQAEERYNDPDLNKKICMYSDHRVTPTGVVPLMDRIEEGLNRFLKNKKLKDDNKRNYDKRIRLSNYAQKVEEQIFAVNKLRPADVNDERINDYIKQLKNFNLAVKDK